MARDADRDHLECVAVWIAVICARIETCRKPRRGGEVVVGCSWRLVCRSDLECPSGGEGVDGIAAHLGDRAPRRLGGAWITEDYDATAAGARRALGPAVAVEPGSPAPTASICRGDRGIG